MNAAHSVGIGDRAYFETWYRDRAPSFYAGILAEIIQHGDPGSILDIGCGPGLFVELAASWGIDASGLDGSGDAVEFAKARNPHLRVQHWELSRKLPFADHAFSNILLHQVIEHLPPATLINVFAECNRLLRSGGVVFVFSPARSNRIEVEKDPTHCNPLNPSELRAFLQRAGFEIIHEPNTSRFLANRPLMGRIVRKLMRTRLEDWLSATANAYARRP